MTMLGVMLCTVWPINKHKNVKHATKHSTFCKWYSKLQPRHQNSIISRRITFEEQNINTLTCCKNDQFITDVEGCSAALCDITKR